MRIRYLKPDFFKDEDIAKLSPHTRLFYEGLWCAADKAGRLPDRPERLKAEIFPYENLDTEAMLADLAKPKQSSGRPFINRYVTDGQRYIQIVAWTEHQKPHHTEAESRIPPAPPYGEGNGKGTKQLNPSAELRNGDLTVIEPVKGTEKEKSRRFTPPTAQEVCDYGKSIGFQIDGQQFVDFYTSKGWLVGKTPMKDWKAAVRTWKTRKLTNGATDLAGKKCHCGAPADGRSLDSTDHYWYWCRTCQPKLWEKQHGTA